MHLSDAKRCKNSDKLKEKSNKNARKRPTVLFFILRTLSSVFEQFIYAFPCCQLQRFFQIRLMTQNH